MRGPFVGGWMSRERSRATVWSDARRASLTALLLLAQGFTAAADSDVARVIVKFRAGSALASASPHSQAASTGVRAAALGARLGLPMSGGPAVSDRAQVVFAKGVTSAALAQRLAQESDVEYAVPDERRRIVRSPNDPLYAEGVPGDGPAVGQWYLRAPSGDVRSSLDIEAAWALTNGSPEVVVAVLDTGVRYEHPDLLEVAVRGNLLPGYDMVSDPAMANDDDGRDGDASDPGDWVTQAEIARRGGEFFGCADSPQSSSWHGTQVSGLIAAVTHNGIGMASTAPGVRVLPVRVLGKCGGHDSDILAGMRWAAGLSVPGVPANPYPARVINLSLGSDGPCCTSAYTDSFNVSVGTSFATPLVAGVTALAMSLDRTLSPAQVKELLQRTARPFPTLGSIASSAAPECTPPQHTLIGQPADQLECYCTTTTCGAGMLDAAAALAAAEASRSRGGWLLR